MYVLLALLAYLLLYKVQLDARALTFRHSTQTLLLNKKLKLPDKLELHWLPFPGLRS
jgi:hypothetical protein